MELEKIDKSSSIIKYLKTDNVLNDICSIINSARDYAFQSVNLALIDRTLLQVLDKEAREWYEKEELEKISMSKNVDIFFLSRS